MSLDHGTEIYAVVQHGPEHTLQCLQEMIMVETRILLANNSCVDEHLNPISNTHALEVPSGGHPMN